MSGSKMAAQARSGRFRGESAVILQAGELARHVPARGRHDRGLAAVPRSRAPRPARSASSTCARAAPAAFPCWRRGPTGSPVAATGSAATSVDLTGLPLGTDDNGLPIHGFLAGAGGWRVDGCDTRGATARLRASIDVDAPAFPFPHRIEVLVIAREARARHPDRRRPDRPAAGADRVRLAPVPPAARPAPSGVAAADCRDGDTSRSTASASRPAPPRPSRRKPSRSAGARSTTSTPSAGTAGWRSRPTTAAVELRCDSAYPFAQVWVPAGSGLRRARADGGADQRALATAPPRWSNRATRFSARFVLARQLNSSSSSASDDPCRRLDQRQVREGLREVAQVVARSRRRTPRRTARAARRRAAAAPSGRGPASPRRRSTAPTRARTSRSGTCPPCPTTRRRSRRCGSAARSRSRSARRRWPARCCGPARRRRAGTRRGARAGWTRPGSRSRSAGGARPAR